MAEFKPTNPSKVTDEVLNKAHHLQEVFKGRFLEEEALELLKRNNNDVERAVNYVINHENSKSLLEELNIDMTKIDFVTLEEVRESLARGLSIERERRQFACEECDNVWWRTVPVRKMVSNCKHCDEKYEALSRDKEYGKGEFECSCGHTFSGFAVMGQTSPCFNCNEHCKPVRIVPHNKKWHGPRKSSKNHSCDGPNCFNHHGHGLGHDRKPVTPLEPKVNTVYERKNVETVTPIEQIRSTRQSSAKSVGNGRGVTIANEPTVNTVYTRKRDETKHDETSRDKQNNDMVHHFQDEVKAAGGSSDTPKECIHPKSMRKKKVVHSSKHHVSTGSTVATFLSEPSVRSGTRSDLSDIFLRVGRKNPGK